MSVYVGGTRRGPNASQMNSREKRRRFASLVRRDGECCNHCGSKHQLTIDHKVPVSRGGSNRLENLQILCYFCNQLKSNRAAA